MWVCNQTRPQNQLSHIGRCIECATVLSQTDITRRIKRPKTTLSILTIFMLRMRTRRHFFLHAVRATQPLTKRPSEIHPFLPRRSLSRCAAAGACVEARASPAAPMPVGTEPPTEPPVDPVPPPASPDRQPRSEAPTVSDGDFSEAVPESPPPYLAAGVLPFCILGGDLLFLLGQQLRFRSRARGTSTSFPKTRGASTPAAAGGATTKGQDSGASGAPVKSPSNVSFC